LVHWLICSLVHWYEHDGKSSLTDIFYVFHLIFLHLVTNELMTLLNQ